MANSDKLKCDTILLVIDGKRKALDTGAIPTENLPLKSHETKSTQRRPIIRQEIAASPPVEKPEDFDHFAVRVKKIVVEPCALASLNNTEIRIELCDTDYSIPKYVIHVDSSLHFSLHVFNWLLPEQHTIYMTCGQRITSAKLSQLLRSIYVGEFKICEGLCQDEYIRSIAKDPVDEMIDNSNV